MTRVVDASVVVAGLIDGGAVGAWAATALASGHAVGPALLPAEATNILRRLALAGDLTAAEATLAQGDLAALRIPLFPFAPFAERVWSLRENVTAYDAWYVALAEHLDADLWTLDARLTRATGPQCGFALPPAS